MATANKTCVSYRVVKKSWQYVQPFWYRASVWQTEGRRDGRTDRRTDVQPISITCFSIADARENRWAILSSWKQSYECDGVGWVYNGMIMIMTTTVMMTMMMMMDVFNLLLFVALSRRLRRGTQGRMQKKINGSEIFSLPFHPSPLPLSPFPLLSLPLLFPLPLLPFPFFSKFSYGSLGAPSGNLDWASAEIEFCVF